jgi:hypothetical protein
VCTVCSAGHMRVTTMTMSRKPLRFTMSAG